MRSLLPLLLSTLLSAEGARILAMFPLFGRSHHRFFQPLVRALAEAGHHVVLYSPFPMEDPPANLTNVHMDTITCQGPELDKKFLYITHLPDWKCLEVFLHFEDLVFQEFIEAPTIQKLISSKEQFDLVISEPWTAQEFTLALGHVFSAPVIGVQAFFTNSILNSVAGNSLSLSFIPDCCFSLPTRMTFLERALNSFTILRGLYKYHYEYLPRKEEAMRKHFPDMPPLLEMMDRVSLTFVNDHMTAGYAQPRPPNIIPVAGIHIPPAKPLPPDIQKFMDEAAEGVILFSLGTYTPDHLQPQQYFDMYINVFKKLRQRVLWKSKKDKIQGLPPNVMHLPWTPQSDILAHPKCVLFVTHVGLLSTHETTHFGVPVVTLAQFFDQRRNARTFQEMGVGVRLDITDLSEASISSAINTVLGDPSYAKNAKKMSKIFRDRPLSPEQSVVFWTEYVLRHGGAAHLKPASTQLSWYQLALLDVLAAILAVAASGAVLLYLIITRILKAIFTKKKKSESIKKRN